MIDAGITFEQSELWLPKSYDTFLNAVYTVGVVLTPYMDRRTTPGEVFYSVFGPVRTWFVPGLATKAEANWGNIKFQSNEVITLPLVVHEIGHLFGVRARNRPTKQLWLDRNKLDTRAGADWPGMHPPFIPKYNVVEQWVNAWEVWVMELYSHNANGITPAGAALRAWMDENMGPWVALAMERTR